MKASPTFSQWVLSLPFRVRYLLAYDPELLAGVRRIFARAVRSFLERRARDEGAPDGCSGAVVFVQRFDSGLRLNVHFHALFLDGVFVRPLFGEPRLHTVRPLRDGDVARLTKALRHRILRFLRRKGRLPGEDEPEPEPVPEIKPGKLCASLEGFSLHAGVRVPPGARHRLERLCRYAARPPLALERLSLTEDGRVLYKLKRRWSDGSTHLVFDPLTFLERLAALVPRPRANLVTYHGVLAPAASQRHRIVPETLPRPARTCPTTRIRHPRPIRQPSNGATPGPSSSNGCSTSTF